MISSFIRQQQRERKSLIILQFTHIFTIFFLLSLINCQDFEQTLIPIQIAQKTLNIIQLPKASEQSFTYTPEPIVETQFVQVQPWVIQQNQMNQRVSMLYEYEEWRDIVDNELKLNEIDRFSFQLSESGAEKVFKWTPNLYIKPNSQFMMKVNTFIIEQRKQLNYPTTQKEAHKLEIFTKTSQQNAYYFIGKVYVEKKLIITLGLNKTNQSKQGESRMFRFMNNYPTKILVLVTIHATKKSGNSKLPSEMLKKSLQFSDSLSNSKMMLGQILEQVKELERERQRNQKIKDYKLKLMDEHSQNLLTFTGIQLLVLILSSVIQMYAIRKIRLNYSHEII